MDRFLVLKNQRYRLPRFRRSTLVDKVFTKYRNITFDCFTFLTRIQLKREPVENFFGCLREFSLSSDLGSHEVSIIPCFYCQNARRRKTKTTTERNEDGKKALELAINIEIGIQNQLRISGTTAYTVQKQMANTSICSMQNSWKRPKSSTTNFNKPTTCPNCGYTWSATHRQKCPACRKNCKDCRITNHFAIKFVESLRLKEARTTCQQC